MIYTTNAIESLNSVIRHAIKKRNVFPTDDAVKKVVWLAIQSASRKWTMPLKDWRMAMSRFIIEFGDRLDGHFREKAFTQNLKQAPDDTIVHALCHVSLSAFPTTPVVSLSVWSIFIPQQAVFYTCTDSRAHLACVRPAYTSAD